LGTWEIGKSHPGLATNQRGNKLQQDKKIPHDLFK
jgi:hypothetical protein